MEQFIALVSFLYFSLRAFLNINWIRFNHFLFNLFRSQKKDDEHVCLTIGDGLAEGFGDYVTMGEIAGFAKTLGPLSRVRVTSQLRRNWWFLKAGRRDASVKDWDLETGKLWKECEGSLLAQADVVIVAIAGAADCGETGPLLPVKEFVSRVSSLVQALLAKDKWVLLLTIPIGEGLVSLKRKEWVLEVNRQLKALTAKEANEQVVLFDCNSVMLNRIQPFFLDGIHLSSAGYREISHQIMKQLAHTFFKKVEWIGFKKFLTG
eukprot:GILI01050141.1.p1 GENE.GILI01050141.1~~GILI01050141.1.p1  ORF type:complete len:263 (+),score=84.24 GILI01050141.1:31-819(+)